MEEILASIRRIISEDGDTAPLAREANDAGAAPAAEAEAVYDLTQEVDAEGNPVTAAEMVKEPAAEAAKQEAAKSKQAEIDAVLAPAAEAAPAQDEASLVGNAAEAAAAASFAALTEKVAPPGDVPHTPAVSGYGRTVEQLAADLLRPMLKAWLDENLPGLVERLVKREIERIAGSRRL